MCRWGKRLHCAKCRIFLLPQWNQSEYVLRMFSLQFFFSCSNASNYFISVRNQHPQWDHLLNYTNDVAAKKGAKTFDIPFLMLGFWTLFEVRNSTIKTEFNWLNFPIKHNIESHFPSKFMITLFNLHVTFRRANEEYKWSTFSLWLISKCKYSVWFLDKISHFTDTFFVDIFIG